LGAGGGGRGVALLVQVFPHTDCFAVLVSVFAVWNEVVFFIKSQNAFIVFYVGIDGEKTGGAIGGITGPRKTLRTANHKSSNAFVFFQKTPVNRQFGDFHGRYGLEGVFKVVEFFLGE
jgi:hypothetical protein